MCKKIIVLFISFSIISSLWGTVFCVDKPADKISVNLILPERSNARLSKVRVDTKPVLVSGTVPVEIGKSAQKADMEDGRYVVEYFIDDDLVKRIDGSDPKDLRRADFGWFLDTAKYKNGRHKLIANFWDKDSSSSIGIVDIIVDNPVSIEQIREATSGE